MTDYIALLNADLEKGYSKSDLEKLIGLPKNNLSGILKGDRKLSKKSELKIEKWDVSEKPNPLTLHELVYANGVKKGQLAEKSLIDLAKNATKDTPTDSEYKNYTAKVSNVVIMDIEKTQRIAKIEELLKASPKYLPKSKRTLLENELMELKNKQVTS